MKSQLLVGILLLILSQFSMASQDYPQVMAQVLSKGDVLAQEYQPEQALRFGSGFSDLYFGGFEGEGLEFAVGQADAEKMVAIELSFSQLINAAVSGQPTEKVQALWEGLRLKLDSAPMIAGEVATYTELFIQSLLILLREGVEALLVIAALIAYLRKAGAADRIPLIWAGAGVAIIASFITAWIFQSLLKNSGSSREFIEGFSLLVAAVLLSYMSVWLFARREMQQWQGFIHNKMGQALDQKRLSAIVIVSFFAVYREGAETILFYQVLYSDTASRIEPLLLGAGVAALALGLIYVAIFLLSLKLPLKQFFSGTAALLFALSVIFVGKAALELQVAGFISATAISYVPFISWLGLFPTVESVGLQLLFIVIPIMGFVVKKKLTYRAAGAVL
ncbi:FTR1 family protein [Neptunomonas sp.]|uniref:FTR1 family iron permease n=1 Tax=Neptunomonas sp. TaxID=1971898 RepID=UPI0025E67D0A|nr:FTR1 family protein [Neptunomonas sp.]